MLTGRKSYREVKRLIPNYKAIGINEMFLDTDDFDAVPWHLVTEVKPWGSNRLDITTGLRFSFTEDGFGFLWSIDVEDCDANGHGEYRLNTSYIARVASALSPAVRQQMSDYLLDCAQKVRTRADEYQGWAQRMYGDAAAFARLANSVETEAVAS
jgi:hypothetical protein